MNKSILSLLFACSLFCFSACKQGKVDDTITVSIPVEEKSVDIIFDSQKYQDKTEITFAEMQEDLETFIYLIETAYIGYDDALERGLDTNVQRQKILASFENHEIIRIQDFMNVLYESFKDYVQDVHASINYWNYDYTRSFIQKGYVYFSDIYVQKLTEKYYVFESNLPDVKIGAQYNSGSENLMLYPAKGNDVYRIGCVSVEDIKSIKLDFDNFSCNLPVHKCSNAKGNENFACFELAFDKSTYIKYNRCSYNNDAELEAMHKFAESYKNCMDKDFVILDVRGNYGGDDYYLIHFLCGLYDLNEGEINFGLDEKWLYSPATIKSLKTLIPYETDVNNPTIQNMLEELAEYEKKMNKKSQKITVDKKASEKSNFDIPKFKGKLILLTDKVSASSGEDCIAYANALFAKTGQFIQVGQNTSGAQLYGNVCSYILKNSGLQVNLSMTDFSSIPNLTSSFHGEGYGYYPDYWTTNEDMNDTLFAVTKDKELYEYLKNNHGYFWVTYVINQSYFPNFY